MSPSIQTWPRGIWHARVESHWREDTTAHIYQYAPGLAIFAACDEYFFSTLIGGIERRTKVAHMNYYQGDETLAHKHLGVPWRDSDHNIASEMKMKMIAIKIHTWVYKASVRHKKLPPH